MNSNNENDQCYAVYVHINKSNFKKYVGITARDPEVRWRSNGEGYKSQSFYNAIKKYGWDNFDHVILDKNLTWEEANQKEKKYIEAFDSYNHGYNRSYGGDGCNGFTWTEESKKKMVETRLKNESFKGSNNPAYGRSPRERLSEDAYWNWRKSLCNHEIKNAKKVICVTTGEIFDRIGKAAEKYNVKTKNIYNSIRRHLGAIIDQGDYHLYYVFDYYEEGKEYNLIDYCYKYCPKSVICLETMKVFWTSNDAGHIMGITGSSIARVCKNMRSQTNGYHFMYVKDYINIGIPDNFYDYGKQVFCLTTNELFKTATDAKRKYPSASTIGISCNKDMSYSGKYDNVPLVWQYYKDYLEKPKDVNSIIKNNSIHCITLDLYFSNASVASKYIGVCSVTISEHLHGNHKFAGHDKDGAPLLWEYYTHTINDGIDIIQE